MDIWAEAFARIAPAHAVPLASTSLYVVLGLALAVVVVRPAWSVARLGVTLVHELGHALVGVAAGRRFTGFVLRSDASGHAVTRGPARGAGRVLSTWAGYPAPAVVGALLVLAAGRGWAAPVLSVVLLVLLVNLVRVRSALTAVVTLGVLVATAALWWWRDDAVQQQVVLCAGLLLVVGAWRHVGAVARDASPGSDPAVLAQLTRVPRLLWVGTFAVVCAGATWVVVTEVLPLVR